MFEEFMKISGKTIKDMREEVERGEYAFFCPACKGNLKSKGNEEYQLGYYICEACRSEWYIDGWDMDFKTEDEKKGKDNIDVKEEFINAS